MNRVLHEVYLFPNGTIARVVKIDYDRVKLRCIRFVVGTERPYTYQRYCSSESLKRAKRIGTEQILIALFYQYKNNIVKSLYR